MPSRASEREEGVRELKTNSGLSILERWELKSVFHGASLVGGLFGLAVVVIVLSQLLDCCVRYVVQVVEPESERRW